MATEDRKNTNDREYSNDEIRVFWKPSKCIHVTTCYRELIEVFNPRKRPWINMEGASTEEIIRIVDKCPTDALTYSWKEKKKAAAEPAREKQEETETKAGAEIKVVRDGPLVVKGEFSVTDSKGEKMKTMKMISFCRCGQSRNMPLCDGMHRKIGFSSE